MALLTPRGKALRWLTTHRGITEHPPGSNLDGLPDGIYAAQKRLGGYLVGQPWCGTWFANALLAAGVKGVDGRLGSVSAIEDMAKAKTAPFRGWVEPTDPRWRSRVLRGDGVVLFGRGVHVGTYRMRLGAGPLTFVVTDEGNTSSGNGGSQDNGGGSFRRVRPLSAVHGFALVNYPDK